MEITKKEDDKFDNDVSILGQEVIDTKATGKPANILANWTGLGICFLFVLVGWAISVVIRKSA